MATFKHTLDIPFASTAEDFMHMLKLSFTTMLAAESLKTHVVYTSYPLFISLFFEAGSKGA